MISYLNQYKYPLIACFIAILITATMDFTGLIAFSAFPLILISLGFWGLLRLSKGEIGLRLGPRIHYGFALLYPLLVISAAVLISYVIAGFQMKAINPEKEIYNLLIQLAVGPLVVLLTEEGFFRGVLWAAFRKAGMSSTHTLYITSIFFTLWHVSAVTAESSYGLPLAQIPVYLINATLLGLVWGLLRMISGSALVPALSHAVWNALAYTLFSFGTNTGMLGIENTQLLGPEVGLLGILLNGLFFIWLWRKSRAFRSNLPENQDVNQKVKYERP